MAFFRWIFPMSKISFDTKYTAHISIIKLHSQTHDKTYFKMKKTTSWMKTIHMRKNERKYFLRINQNKKILPFSSRRGSKLSSSASLCTNKITNKHTHQQTNTQEKSIVHFCSVFHLTNLASFCWRKMSLFFSLKVVTFEWPQIRSFP